MNNESTSFCRVSAEFLEKVQALASDFERLKNENEKLRECVGFYANCENWTFESCHDIKSRIYLDNEIADEPQGDSQKGTWVGGKLARQTLKELGERDE